MLLSSNFHCDFGENAHTKKLSHISGGFSSEGDPVAEESISSEVRAL